MAKKKSKADEAIKLMYGALMQISFVSSEFFTFAGALQRAQDIANDALREMNSKHTGEVQKALGLLD